MTRYNDGGLWDMAARKHSHSSLRQVWAVERSLSNLTATIACFERMRERYLAERMRLLTRLYNPYRDAQGRFTSRQRGEVYPTYPVPFEGLLNDVLPEQ